MFLNWWTVSFIVIVSTPAIFIKTNWFAAMRIEGAKTCSAIMSSFPNLEHVTEHALLFMFCCTCWHVMHYGKDA